MVSALSASALVNGSGISSRSERICPGTTVALGFSVGVHSPAGAFCCGAEDNADPSEVGVDVVVTGGVVADGVFSAGAEDADGADVPAVTGVQGTDVAVGTVVLVGTVFEAVVEVVDVTGSHESSACDCVALPGDSPGRAILAATGVVTRTSAVVETARARENALLRRMKCGADISAIRYPSST